MRLPNFPIVRTFTHHDPRFGDTALRMSYRGDQYMFHRSLLKHLAETRPGFTFNAENFPKKWVSVEDLYDTETLDAQSWRILMTLVHRVAQDTMYWCDAVCAAYDSWAPRSMTFAPDTARAYTLRTLNIPGECQLFLLDDVISAVYPELINKGRKHTFRWLTVIGVGSHMEIDAKAAQALDTRYPAPRAVFKVLKASGPDATLCFLTHDQVLKVLAAVNDYT